MHFRKEKESHGFRIKINFHKKIIKKYAYSGTSLSLDSQIFRREQQGHKPLKDTKD